MDMTNSLVKPRNILLTMKEYKEKNVTTIKQVYNARYLYKKLVRGDRTEMQQLMMLLERDIYMSIDLGLKKKRMLCNIYFGHTLIQ